MERVNVHYMDKMAYHTLTSYLKDIMTDDTVLTCIGTDRCIEDCLGPLVGTMLEEDEFFPLPVYGTLEEPIHALNMHERFENIKKMHPNSKIIAIDASLDDSDTVGELHVRDIPISPGVGLGKKLPKIGDASIIGIVDSLENRANFRTNGVRLNLPFKMARIISQSIIEGYNLYYFEQQERTCLKCLKRIVC